MKGYVTIQGRNGPFQMPTSAVEQLPGFDQFVYPGDAMQTLGYQVPETGMPAREPLVPMNEQAPPLGPAEGIGLLADAPSPEPAPMPEPAPSAEPEDKLELGRMTEADALRRMAEAEATRADIVAQGKVLQAGQLEQQARELDTMRQEHQAKIDNEIARLQVDRKNVAQMKPDQTQWWTRKSAVGQLGTIISAAIGGYMAPMYGGKNSALDAIEKEIERNLQLQRDEMLNAKEGLRSKESLLSFNVKRYGDMETAMRQTHAMLRESVAAQIEAQASQYNSDVIRAKAQQASGELLKQNAMDDAKLGQVRYSQWLDDQRLKLGRYQARTGRISAEQAHQRGMLGLQMEQRKIDAAGAPKPIPADSASVLRGLTIKAGGKTIRASQANPVVFGGKEQRKDVEEVVGRANSIIDGLQKMKELGVERTTPGLDSERKQQIDLEVSNIMRLIIESGPRISDIDIEWYKKSIVGDITKFARIGDEKFRNEQIDRVIKIMTKGANDKVSGLYTGKAGIDYRYEYTPGEEEEAVPGFDAGGYPQGEQAPRGLPAKEVQYTNEPVPTTLDPSSLLGQPDDYSSLNRYSGDYSIASPRK